MGIRRAVEIGVDRGLFAAEFLARWQGDILVCIDPWEPYPHMPYDRTPDLLMAVNLLSPFKSRVKIIRARSPEAAGLLGPYSQPGFVYIDGSHDYDDVKKDIAGWWPVVVPGGILAGHDYTDEAFGVKQAVNEFVAQYGVVLNLTVEANEAISWWVQKA